MSIVPQNPTYAYVGAFVDELARAGVKHAVICPGSRSTPLTLTFAAEDRIKKWVLVDERSAAFFALGIAKRSGEPVALVCTSGTAAANFFPAVCEAKEARVPLLVLTADRPPELQNVGAPQTMGQKYLYGEHVKWFTEMPLPEATNTVMRYARFTANRAVAESKRLPLGPVHLNFPFREPLTNQPVFEAPLLAPELQDTPAWTGGRWALSPYIAEQTDSLMQYSLSEPMEGDFISGMERGLIVLGPQEERKFEYYLDPSQIIHLAKRLQWPVLVDPLSLISRAHNLNTDLYIDSYDAFLRDTHFVESAKPDFILRFGAMPTSKVLNQYLQKYGDYVTWIIDESMGWRDANLTSSAMLGENDYRFISKLLEYLPQRQSTEWTQLWLNTAKNTQQVLKKEIVKFTDIFEGRVFTELSEILPNFSRLFVGNSMPIRDCDTFLPLSDKGIRVYGNRGVNGIDGQVSTALGIAATQDAGEPTVLVVGDLTFYHDLNGLLAAKKYGLNLTVVVINNDGGGIFSFLPQAEHAPADHFEEYFGTAAGLDYSHVTAMYGGTFTRISNWDEFRAAVSTGISEGGLHVVEVPTNRQKNVEMHRHLWRKVSEALGEVRG